MPTSVRVRVWTLLLVCEGVRLREGVDAIMWLNHESTLEITLVEDKKHRTFVPVPA